MKTRNIAIVVASALLTVGLIPFASAHSAAPVPEGIEVITVVGKRLAPENGEAFAFGEARPIPEGIEVITVVGTHAMPEGIEVVTVVGKRADAAVRPVRAGA
jgi:hypothetical protein